MHFELQLEFTLVVDFYLYLPHHLKQVRSSNLHFITCLFSRPAHSLSPPGGIISFVAHFANDAPSNTTVHDYRYCHSISTHPLQSMPSALIFYYSSGSRPRTNTDKTAPTDVDMVKHVWEELRPAERIECRQDQLSDLLLG